MGKLVVCAGGAPGLGEGTPGGGEEGAVQTEGSQAQEVTCTSLDLGGCVSKLSNRHWLKDKLRD